jgi:hypothetical protein
MLVHQEWYGSMMRIYVILDSEGTVVGTAPVGAQAVGDLTLDSRPIALEGQVVQEILVPSELEDLDPLELHNALGDYQIKPGETEPIKRGS